MMDSEGEQGGASGQAIGTLSEQQRACLRLVAAGMSSKEIALQTGLSPQTVDTYLKVAIARLGVTNRREAARMLSLWEASRNSGSPTPAVAPAPNGPQSGAVTAIGGWRAWTALPPLGGRWNDLDWATRTFAVLKVAALSAVVVIAIALIVAAAFSTFA